ncbi:MAG: uracil-DNA glycosylase family protein [Treponema sp.]|nr:uracil-DNA glycosylase family protein [Treponema sp.]
MTAKSWELFARARESYRAEVARMERELPELRALQQELVDRHLPTYRVETPLVYNGSLDDLGPESDIRLILVGDNPGRREQAAENRRYLVGPSGKIAERFFREKPELGIDFRRNVVILNKTPIHTPRTAGLRELSGAGGPELEAALERSQREMARLLPQFQRALSEGTGRNLPIWITGYSEMKKGGIFAAYTDELKAIYGSAESRESGLSETLFLYRHFSMNQFLIDLKQQSTEGESLTETLRRIGIGYRKRFLY